MGYSLRTYNVKINAVGTFVCPNIFVKATQKRKYLDNNRRRHSSDRQLVSICVKIKGCLYIFQKWMNFMFLQILSSLSGPDFVGRYF